MGEAKIRFSAAAVAFFLIAPAAGSQPLEERLDFEELQPGCVASSVSGDWGSGPVRIRGTSPRFGDQINAAVVVDTAHPDIGDTDLASSRYHNALIVSRLRPTPPPGPDAAWVAGSVRTVNDEDIPGAVLAFDFRDIGPVTFYGLTLLDHDDRPVTLRIYRQPGAKTTLESVAPGARLDLTWGRKPLFTPNTKRARLTLPTEERPFYTLQVAPGPRPGSVREVELRRLRAGSRETRSLVGRGPILGDGISDVARLEVELGGSSAVDRVLFRRQGPYPPPSDEGLFTKIEERIAGAVQPELELVRAEFFATWQELVDQQTEYLRSDLDALIVDLGERLLGTPQDDGTRRGGLLQCPELPCGCPELRALQAWVDDRIAKIRADLAATPADDEAPAVAARSEVRIAAVDPAAYVFAAQSTGSIELAQQARSQGCESGTFWELFFCEGRVLFNGVSGAIASLMGTSVELEAGSVEIAGVAQPCEAFRLTPKSAEFHHVETGILPGQTRRVPRGLYCVLCRTAEGALQPLSTLDLVTDVKGGPTRVGDEAERCAVSG